jgi:hypothetical protein
MVAILCASAQKTKVQCDDRVELQVLLGIPVVSSQSALAAIMDKGHSPAT